MTENPGTRAGLNVGDRVKVHSDATSEFVIVRIDGEDAVIESVRDDVPGRFPFHARLERLVPVDSGPQTPNAI